jgi:hypothetical protein
MTPYDSRKLRLLILTQPTWNHTTTCGNTYSSIFGGIGNLEVANIYCHYGTPDNSIVSRYYQITEKAILASLFGRGPAGSEKHFPKTAAGAAGQDAADALNKQERGVFNWMRTVRFRIFYWGQELIWKTGKWKSAELRAFVKDFDPDIIWVPIFYTVFTNDIGMYLHQITNKPVVCYISDDNYTLKQFSLSPFYWIDRFIKRPKIRRMIGLSSHLYVITEKQKQEYDPIFHVHSTILTKGADFQKEMPALPEVHAPVRLLFMGSIGLGRWKSLVLVAQALDAINRESGGAKGRLEIHTVTPLTRRMEQMLNIPGTSSILPPIDSSRIDETFQENDILVHVEPTDLRQRLYYRLSFSTKLVDYFRNARCIFAFGGNSGSMEYLRNEDAAVLVQDKAGLKDALRALLNDPQKIREYSRKSWECGCRNHEIKSLQSRLYSDLVRCSLGENDNDPRGAADRR